MKKTLLELNQEYNKYPEYHNFHVSYQFNHITKEWKFLGYHCIKCGRILKQRNVVPRHEENCKEIKKFKKNDTNEHPIKVLNNFGKEWKPFTDNIQN